MNLLCSLPKTQLSFFLTLLSGGGSFPISQRLLWRLVGGISRGLFQRLYLVVVIRFLFFISGVFKFAIKLTEELAVLAQVNHDIMHQNVSMPCKMPVPIGKVTAQVAQCLQQVYLPSSWVNPASKCKRKCDWFGFCVDIFC